MTATRSGWISAVRGRNPRGVSGAKFAEVRPRPCWKMLPSVFAMAVPSDARRPYRGLRRRASGRRPCTASRATTRASLRAGEGRLELLARDGVAHPGEPAPVLHLPRASEEG